MSADVLPYGKPLPRRGELERPFWEGCANGELRLQCCSDCGHWRFPPSPLCPTCLGDTYEWRLTSGRGKVWSWIVMHQQYFASFAEDLPYNVALIELDEGPWIMSSLVHFDGGAVHCGAVVQVQFEQVTDDVFLPRFVLSETSVA